MLITLGMCAAYPYGMVTLASFTGFLVGAISAFVVMAVCE